MVGYNQRQGGGNVKNTIADQLLAVLAPHHCCGCGLTGTLLCARCNDDIVEQPILLCLSCTRRPACRHGICAICHPPYSRAWSIGADSGSLEKLLREFKFGPARAAADLVAELLASRLPDLPAETVLVPLPTINRHVRERGFDHTRLLARKLASIKKIDYDADLLRRRSQAVQRGQSGVVRQRQAKDAYRLIKTVSPDQIYLLLDDVMTTGASLWQAAKLLKRDGVQQVWVVAAARHIADE